MRIVHVISSLKRGGAETVLASLLKHPLCDSIEHHVIYFHDGPLRQQLQKKNIRLYHIRYSPLFFFRFLYQMHAINPHGIHALLWFAIVSSSIVGFFLRIPVMAVFHNNLDQNCWYKNYIDWFVLRLVTQYVAVSTSVAQSVCQYHTSIALSAIKIIHNGIDMPQYDYKYEGLKCRAQYDIPSDAVVIGSVGRFEAVKRYTWLLDCFATISKSRKDVRLILVGTGSQEQMLRDYANTKNIGQCVRFIVDQDAYMIYPCFDIFTLTSGKEGISIALLEAMSYSKACLITNSESSHAVISNGYNGFIVAPDDKELFCSTFNILAADSSLRKNLGNNAHQTVRGQFSRGMMVEQYVQQFQRLARHI